MDEELQPLETIVNAKMTLSQALLFMNEHRSWSDTTFESYQYDVRLFEAYLMNRGLEPTLENGQHLILVSKWIAQQKENDVAYKTIMRRVASLSSLYTFYKDLGTVQANAFKASSVSGEHSQAHSRTLDIHDLKKVYGAIEGLKKEGIYIGIPIKLLLFTGLRNHAITKLKVKNIVWDEEMLVYDELKRNSKNKYQLLPLPPILLKELSAYVEEEGLIDDDSICYGIKGYPLKNKQLNALVNKINQYLNWSGDERVTPHGFRYTIATLLDERGVSVETIQYLLGHSSTKNVDSYIRRNERKIKQIKDEITNIEKELEECLVKNKGNPSSLDRGESSNHDVTMTEAGLPYSEEFILQLSKSNPKLLEKLMMDHYQH